MKSIREYIILIESADAPLVSGMAEGHNQFLVKELINDQQVIDYVRTTLIPEMRAYGVPITPHNHYSRLSSAIFESVSGVIDSGKKFLKTFEKLDQRRNMKITVGTMVSILNLRMSQDFAELFGFKTPKKITKIYREPTDNKIIQLEFNNDPEDVWPRHPLASYNGNIIMHSALFPSAEDLDKAFMTLMLAKPDDLTVRSNILETNKKQGVAEEASPMIKPANNRFDNKQEAFKYAKEHGGSVFKSQYIDPNTGVKNISFVVKKKIAEGAPDFSREWEEAVRYPEFVRLGKEKWIELAGKGKPVTVTRKNVDKIHNTDAADPESFKLLDPEKQKRALAQLANGDVEMPVVARYSDGYLELIGGNTRLTAQMAKDGQAEVWIFDVPTESELGVTEGVPQPGPSSGAPKQFGPDAKIQTRQMTVKDIISSVPGVPYYNNVVDDWDAKDYSWGVTKKVIEYATYLKDHPESLAKLPPAIVLNGKFEDGAHRVSAIWLLQQRMDPKNPLWKNTKLNVQFVKQGVAEGGAETSWSNDTGTITLQDILELTKHIKQINLPINDNLKSKLLHWEGNPEEIERVNQVTVSNQFPILIMVDEQGQIAWILDGNHRLHKAIQSRAKTIPAKLIKPSNLNDKAKKIFNIKEQGVAEGSEQINEYRDRLLQYVKSLLPTWPEYVLKDWLVPNKGDFSNLPADALKNSVMEKVQGAGLTTNSKWQLVPNMKFTMDMFDPMTKQRLIGRAGGTSDLGMGIPKDKERHATQAALAQQQGGVRKEPVLLIKTAKGYELLEGWHRTIQHFVKYPNGYTGPAYVTVAQGQQGVTEGREQDVPPVLYHATYKPRLKSIKLNGLGTNGKRNWEDSQHGVVYLALDPYVAESYAEASDMVPDEWLDQIVILKISTAGLDSNKFYIDSNVLDNAGDTIEYHGVIPASNISLYKTGVAKSQCPECGGDMVHESLINEKKDACYYKVKSRYKVWPSAYASGALVKCRKKGAKNWGTSTKKNESASEIEEDLHKWFKEKWVRFGPDGKIRGDCARGGDSEGKPKCLPQSKANALGKKGRASAATRKRREDPNPDRSGKAINVKTKKKSNESMIENNNTVKHRVAVTVIDPNYPNKLIQKVVRIFREDSEKAINAVIANYNRKGYKVHDYNYLGVVSHDQQVAERMNTESSEFINELTFHGSQCTKDCSGHRAGYNWNLKKTQPPAGCDGSSQSFINGCNIAAKDRRINARTRKVLKTTTFEGVEHDEQAFQEQKQQFMEMFEKFLPIAMNELKLKKLPKMVFEKKIEDSSQPTFGQYVNDEKTLYVALSNRHPVDILRTIAHELVHYWQDMHDMLNHDSGKTGSPEENQAHEKAGIIMRKFNKANPQYMASKPIFEGTMYSQYNHLDVVKNYKPTKTLPRNDMAVGNSEQKLAKMAKEAEQSKAENKKLKRKKEELENYLKQLSRPE